VHSIYAPPTRSYKQIQAPMMLRGLDQLVTSLFPWDVSETRELLFEADDGHSSDRYIAVPTESPVEALHEPRRANCTANAPVSGAGTRPRLPTVTILA